MAITKQLTVDSVLSAVHFSNELPWAFYYALLKLPYFILGKLNLLLASKEPIPSF